MLLDCDGVLVDTERTSAAVLAEMLAEHGVQLDADHLRAEMRGTTLQWIEAQSATLLGRPVPDGWMEDFIERRLVHYRRGVDPIPGAAALIRGLRAAGIPLAVASQGTRQKMAVTLPASGLDRELGDAPIFSGDDVERGKPHPDLYLLAASTLGAEPARTVVVEDSVPGVTGAVAAGMRVFGYAGEEQPERLRAAGAEVLQQLDQLLPILGIA